MKLSKFLLIILCLFLFTGSRVYSQVFSFEANPNASTATFPRGTMFRAELQNIVSSRDNRVGDPVFFEITSDVLIGKAVCIPEGSYMTGKIVQLEHARQGRDGYFQILVDKLIFPDGWQTAMSGKIWTKDGTGIVGGGITKRQNFRKMPHHIEDIGPIVQLVRTGEREIGKERTLPEGKKVIIVLNHELKVNYLEKYE